MSKPQVQPEKIHLIGLRILKSHFETDLNNHNQFEVSHFGVGLKSESGFSLEESGVQLRLYIKIRGFDADQNAIDVFGEYLIEFHFTVENLTDFVTVNTEDEGFLVDSMIGATLAGIAYSTSRGIILDRTQSTDFKGVILPVINPQQLLSEDTFSNM